MRLVFLLLVPWSVFGASLFTAEARYNPAYGGDLWTCSESGPDWAGCRYSDDLWLTAGGSAGAGFSYPFYGIASANAWAISGWSVGFVSYAAAHATFDLELAIDLADPEQNGMAGYLILNCDVLSWGDVCGSSLGSTGAMLPYNFGETFRVWADTSAQIADGIDVGRVLFNSIDVFNSWGAWIGNVSTRPDASGHYLIGPPQPVEDIAAPEPGSFWMALPVLMLAARTVRRGW